MSQQYHMCNATNGDWAYISLYYFSNNCTLIRYEYADPYEVPVLLFYIYFISYYTTLIILFPLILYFIFKILFSIKNLYSRFISPEHDALLAVHPDGYWAELVEENAPFGALLRRMFNR